MVKLVNGIAFLPGPHFSGKLSNALDLDEGKWDQLTSSGSADSWVANDAAAR